MPRGATACASPPKTSSTRGAGCSTPRWARNTRTCCTRSKAHARSTDEWIAPRLNAGLAKATRGLSAADWRALNAELPLHDSLQYSDDRALRALLDEARGDIERAQLADFVKALAPEAQRLRAA